MRCIIQSRKNHVQLDVSYRLCYNVSSCGQYESCEFWAVALIAPHELEFACTPIFL